MDLRSDALRNGFFGSKHLRLSTNPERWSSAKSAGLGPEGDCLVGFHCSCIDALRLRPTTCNTQAARIWERDDAVSFSKDCDGMLAKPANSSYLSLVFRA